MHNKSVLAALFVWASFALLLFTGCQQAGKPALPSKETIPSIQETKDISDSPANREHFEKQRALWASKRLNHYQVDFVFKCDCTYRTDQLREVLVNGQPTTERGGEVITVEVQNGHVIDLHKENGERGLVGEFRRPSKASLGLPEYLWNVGKDDKYQCLISDPIAFLWACADKAFQTKAPVLFNITYDGNWGFIKSLEFNSGIPDYEYKGYLKNFTVLN